MLLSRAIIPMDLSYLSCMRREIWEATASFSLEFYLSSNRDIPISHPLPVALGGEQVENELDKFSVEIAF